MPSNEPFTLDIPALYDTHIHLREDNKKQTVVADLIGYSHEGGASIIGPVMPNTEAGLLTAEQVVRYIRHAQKTCRTDEPVTLVPCVQITEQTTRADIDACVESGIMHGKIYPLNRTTKSELGVRDYHKLLDICEHAGRKSMFVHVHPEHPFMLIGNRDAEYLFLNVMDMLMRETRRTTFVWEHGTDARCIPFWKEWAADGRFFVTLTAHHLATNENETYGDVQATCKPSYKTLRDQTDLCDLVAEDHPWVMAGSDSAPHPHEKKHVLGPCACGAFTAPFLLPLYAHALPGLLATKQGQQTFVKFTSKNACNLYNTAIPRRVTLTNEPFTIPDTYRVGRWSVEPFWAGQSINYSLKQ